MAGDPNKLSRFWKELKRRNVHRLMAVYAGTAFVILEASTIIFPRWDLPDWTIDLVLYLLILGAIMTFIISWIYDITPEGVRKTKPINEAQGGEISPAPNGWKIASYISFAVIIGLFALNFIPRIKAREVNEILDKSIAVLPFISLSDDPDKQYLADGVMEDILLHLAKINDLRVISSTSVQQYRNTSKTATEICRELDVSYVLEGRFQKYGDQVKLMVQLIQTGIEGHAWANDYDREWTDIFTVQSEVARAIAGELHAVIRPEEKQLIEKIPTTNLSAYNYFLLGQHFHNLRTPESLLQAKSYYEKAIESDPKFVRAYTGLANCYGNLAFYGSLSPEDAYPSALKLAMQALKLDSLFADAYNVIGTVDLFYHWDFSSAESNYRHAIELDPNNLMSYKSYAEILFFFGRFSESVEMDLRAMSIDPIYPLIDGLFGVHLYFAQQKDSAILHLKHMVELYPVCQLYLGVIFLHEGEYERSIHALEKYLGAGFSSYALTQLGLAYSNSGELNETQRILDTLEARAKNEFVPYSMRGSLLVELGHNWEALNYLRKGCEEREEFILLLKNIDTISYSKLRSDPVFIEIMNDVWAEK